MTTDHAAYRPAARVVLAAVCILMVPLLAMQFTDEVVWGPLDFVVAGVLLIGTGLAYQLAVRKGGTLEYTSAAAVALAAALLLVWLNLAVGVIGDEGNPGNAMYIGVLAVGIVGAFIARFEPNGMARTLSATALAQALVGAIAVVFELGAPESGPLELSLLNGFFVALFAVSALLFRRAARTLPSTSAGSAD